MLFDDVQGKRRQWLELFDRYISSFDKINPRIALKLVHTKHVATLCDSIARTCSLDQRYIDLAWLVGLLHDVGRFEQIKQYDTFNDAASIDHALLGVDIIFERNNNNPLAIENFELTAEERLLVRRAIELHSTYELPQNLSDSERTMCQILRDADKIDIIRVNVTEPLETIYRTSEEEMLQSALSPECVRIFYEHRCLPRTVRNYPADVFLSHLCFAWELVYPESLVILREQGFLAHMLERPWGNPQTAYEFEKLARHMRVTLQL